MVVSPSIRVFCKWVGDHETKPATVNLYAMCEQVRATEGAAALRLLNERITMEAASAAAGSSDEPEFPGAPSGTKVVSLALPRGESEPPRLTLKSCRDQARTLDFQEPICRIPHPGDSPENEKNGGDFFRVDSKGFSRNRHCR
jgi:hypothetical protein